MDRHESKPSRELVDEAKASESAEPLARSADDPKMNAYLREQLLGEDDPMNDYMSKKQLKIKMKTEFGKLQQNAKKRLMRRSEKLTPNFVCSLSNVQRSTSAKSLWNRAWLSMGRRQSLEWLRGEVCASNKQASSRENGSLSLNSRNCRVKKRPRK